MLHVAWIPVVMVWPASLPVSTRQQNSIVAQCHILHAMATTTSCAHLPVACGHSAVELQYSASMCVAEG